MRKSSVLFSVVALNFGAAGIAQAAPQPATVQQASSQKPSRTRLAAKTPTYAQLKKSLKIDPLLSLATVRADRASFAGRAIELSAIVTGTIGKDGARAAILSVENSVLRLDVSSEVLNGALLRAGASVHVLAIVGASDDNDLGASSDVKLQLLAATSVRQTALKNDATQGDSSQNDWAQNDFSQKSASQDDSRSAASALDNLPAAVDIPLLKPSGRISAPSVVRGSNSTSSTRYSNRSAPVSNAPISADAPITEDDSAGVFDAQMPAYRAMVRRFNAKLSPDLVDKIALALLQAGTNNGMDPRFLASIISVESDFDIYCRSSSGAMGLGQLMPFNLSEAKITNAWDPVQNVWGTARLLRGHLNDYRNRADGTLLAVAAYNAGPGAVRRAGFRVPAGSQVQRYVWKVYNRYKEFAPDMFSK